MKIVDAHAHIASWPTIEKTEEMLLSSNEKYGICYSLLSNGDAAEFPSRGEDIPTPLNTITSTEQALEFTRAHPQQFGALLWIRPHFETVTPELEEYVRKHRKEIHGLKLHPYNEQIKANDPLLEPWFALAEKHRFPILVHTAMDIYSSINYLGDIAGKHPTIRFVAAHMELCSDHQRTIEVMKEHANIYADTAWVPMDIAKRVLYEVGENRIMFGSDNPIDGMDTLANPVYQAYFNNAENLPQELYENLMGHNAIAFYHLPVSED